MREEILSLPIFSVSPDKNQARKQFTEEALQELAESIKHNGVIVPILVTEISKGRYQIIAGERRWRASIMAKKSTIPAVVRSLKPIDKQLQSLLENVQRHNLNPLEEAEAYAKLIEEYAFSQEDLSEYLGKNRASVANLLRLLKLPLYAKEMMLNGELSMGHAKVLLTLDDEGDISYFTRKTIGNRWSVRKLENELQLFEKNKKIAKQKINEQGKEKKISSQQLQLQLQLLETELSRKFSSKVVIKEKLNHRGQIEISFTDMDDLNRILELLK